MRRRIQHVLTLALGWCLVGVGIVGLFLPLLQGVLMIALGLVVLSRESLAVRRVVDRLRVRYPVLDRNLSEVARRFRRERSAEEKASGTPDCPVAPGATPTRTVVGSEETPG